MDGEAVTAGEIEHSSERHHSREPTCFHNPFMGRWFTDERIGMDKMTTREELPPGAPEARVFAAMRVVILDNVDPRTAGVFHAFRAATDLHHQTMHGRPAQHGSHPGEALCLRLIVNQDGIKQSELADILRLSRPWITNSYYLLCENT
jgi:hypothetical protein